MLFSCKCLNLVIRGQRPNDTTAERPNLLANDKIPNNVGMEFFKQVPHNLLLFDVSIPKSLGMSVCITVKQVS